MSDWEPYGKEWEAELMKLTKKDIIALYREICVKIHSIYEEQEVKP